MEGITIHSDEKFTVFEIECFSNELKEKIKTEIVEICHGEAALTSDLEWYSYKETLAELINHRLPRNHSQKVGFIGELLLNVILRAFTDLKIISPFFNMEERNVKKGFDLISVDKENNLWLIESKAGELDQTNLNPTLKVKERIRVARQDLVTRLNRKNTQLWLNATNSVKVSCKSDDEKDNVLQIIANIGKTNKSNDKSVVLGGIVFCKISTRIDLDSIGELSKEIEKKGDFDRVRVVAIHKETFERIEEFLKQLLLGKNDEKINIKKTL